MWEITLYEDENGNIPVNEFILAQSDKMKAKILREIDLLEELGIRLRLPHSRSLGDSLYELRISTEGNISRIIYFHYTGNSFVLLNEFTQKTKRTPIRELKLAEVRMKDYRRRKDE